MKQIKFKRAYFENLDETKFLGFKFWGVRIDESIFTAPTNKSNSQSFIDLQFTGLKDKNSKEVYEGDIMLNNVGCQVIFETGGFIARSNSFFIIPSYFCNCEIIGNIYENADLIN